jgi:nicotinate-nucleotide--dimethylbenzimidazole phosphoribosyltransferase
VSAEVSGFAPPPIAWLDPMLIEALQARIEAMAKPPGALGRLEELAIQIGAIQGRADPRVERVRAYVFAADHGLVAEGVSAYPSAVTAAMVETFLAGRASVNALARACDVEVLVVDAGVDAEIAPRPGLIDAKLRRGSRNAATEPALTREEAQEALRRGVAFAHEAADEGIDALIPGEMGIGNTASAALVMHRLAPAPLGACIGLGAGHGAEGLERKRAAIARAAARARPDAPLDVLAEFGGLEIAMMTGLVLGAAARARVVIVDGFISTVAALAAIRLSPATAGHCVFAHASVERGHGRLLESLAAQPLLSLGLRLGEGTGAVLAAPIVRAAARLMSEVASLDDVLAGRL